MVANTKVRAPQLTNPPTSNTTSWVIFDVAKANVRTTIHPMAKTTRPPESHHFKSRMVSKEPSLLVFEFSALVPSVVAGVPEDVGLLEAKASRTVLASGLGKGSSGASLARTSTSKLIESSPGISQTWSSQACQAIRRATDVAPAASAVMLMGKITKTRPSYPLASCPNIPSPILKSAAVGHTGWPMDQPSGAVISNSVGMASGLASGVPSPACKCQWSSMSRTTARAPSVPA